MSMARSCRATAILVLALLVAPAAVRADSECLSPPRPPAVTLARVDRVVDGDTIVVRLGEDRVETVRFIGVDTPEAHPGEKLARDVARSGQDRETMRALGARASVFTKRHLAGQRVELEADVRARDRNGRLLAYVWRPDGTLFNLVLLRDGYARVYTIAPNVRYATVFLACQREARAAQRGLWAGGGLD
jgi:micrococcal nuclease